MFIPKSKGRFVGGTKRSYVFELTGFDHSSIMKSPARAEERTQTRRRLLLHPRKGVQGDENYISSVELFDHGLREKIKEKKQPPLRQVTTVFVFARSQNRRI